MNKGKIERSCPCFEFQKKVKTCFHNGFHWMTGMLEFIEELHDVRSKYKSLIHVDKNDGHYLEKAVELRTMIDMLEIMFKVFITRKESRGCFNRYDYPERDDKNWLKWVIVQRGEDDQPNIFTERIPFERYPFKPEGWNEFDYE